jgi:hypothetical protein
MADDTRRPSSDSPPSVSPDTGGGEPCTYSTDKVSYDIETLPSDALTRPIAKKMVDIMERGIWKSFSDDWSRIYGKPEYKPEIFYGEGSLGVWPFRIAIDSAYGHYDSTITGRYLNRGIEMQTVFEMQRKKNHLDTVLFTVDYVAIEMRMYKWMKLARKKSDGRKRYLKRYHRIGAMMRRRGKRQPQMIRTGQYALYRGSWAYVVTADEKEVMLSMWRGVKTTVIRRHEVEAVKDKP